MVPWYEREANYAPAYALYLFPPDYSRIGTY